jgi:hypothetical protein
LILLISASWEPKITGVSHLCLVPMLVLNWILPISPSPVGGTTSLNHLALPVY